MFWRLISSLMLFFKYSVNQMQKRHKLLFSIMSSNFLFEICLENQNLPLDQAKLSLALACLYSSWQRKLSPFCSLMRDLITGQNSAKMETVHRSLLGEYKGRNSLCSFYLLRQSQSGLLTFSFPSSLHNWGYLLYQRLHS